MKKLIKGLGMMALTITIIMASILSIYADGAAVRSYGITPYFANCDNAAFTFVVHENGEAAYLVTYVGNSATFTRARLTVQIQKRFLGLFWRDVGSEWIGTSTELLGLFSNSITVDGKGTYRAVFTLEVYGTSGAVDTIGETLQDKYE